jgi:2-keto-4-pentenoate hydratase
MAEGDEISGATALQALARRQWHDYTQRTPGTYFGEEHAELSLDQAYAVQMEVARLRGEGGGDAVVGYKVGCIVYRGVARRTIAQIPVIRAIGCSTNCRQAESMPSIDFGAGSGTN